MKTVLIPQTKQVKSVEKLLETREQLNAIVLEAREEIESINDRLTQALGDEKSKTFGEYTITRATRLSFKDVSLDVAKKFRAIKKVVDADVLKPLYLKGVKIPNVVEFEYVSVRKAK